jgi:hypothetical protein
LTFTAIPGEVDGDRKKPRLEAPSPIESISGGEGTEKALLEELLCLRGAPGESDEHSVELAMEPLDEVAGCALVAREEALRKLLIGERAVPGDAVVELVVVEIGRMASASVVRPTIKPQALGSGLRLLEGGSDFSGV